MRNVLAAKIRASWMQATVLLLSSVLNSCAPGTLPADSGGLHTFHGGGLTLRYPAAWREFRHSFVSSFSTSLVDLATVDVPDPCVSRPANGGTETVCADRFHLAPDTIVVHLAANGFPGFDIVSSRPAGATAVVVGGRPAFVIHRAPDNPAVGADEVITWTISRAEAPGNFYTIEALIRGPDSRQLEEQVQRLVDTVSFDPR
jgi:hypothetical protein